MAFALNFAIAFVVVSAGRFIGGNKFFGGAMTAFIAIGCIKAFGA